MGIYDPSFERREFNPKIHEGEIPGSVVIGTKGNKGAAWPGGDGRWYAARPGHKANVPFPSFSGRVDALEFLIVPMREAHEKKEDARRFAWENAAEKRRTRAERNAERENKRLGRKMKAGEKIWSVLNAEGMEIGRVVRKLEHEARLAAASLLGFSCLPKGYTVKAM